MKKESPPAPQDPPSQVPAEIAEEKKSENVPVVNPDFASCAPTKQDNNAAVPVSPIKVSTEASTAAPPPAPSPKASNKHSIANLIAPEPDRAQPTPAAAAPVAGRRPRLVRFLLGPFGVPGPI